jgi:hypothetical protein
MHDLTVDSSVVSVLGLTIVLGIHSGHTYFHSFS